MNAYIMKTHTFHKIKYDVKVQRCSISCLDINLFTLISSTLLKLLVAIEGHFYAMKLEKSNRFSIIYLFLEL